MNNDTHNSKSTPRTTSDSVTVEKRKWSIAEKLTVLCFGTLVSAGVGLAWRSVDLATEAKDERRQIQELNRDQERRINELWAFGPGTGPRVTKDDIQKSLTDVVGVMGQVIEAQASFQAVVSANTQAMLAVNTSLAEIKASNAAAVRERDMIMDDVRRLEARP